MSGSVVVRDNGAKKLLEQVASMRNAFVEVGVLGADADHGEGLTVGDVATFHEFGTDTIPERSFIRGYVDETKDKQQEIARKATAAVVKGQPIATVLNIVGLTHVAGMQERIANQIDPPLAEETIKRKGSSVPLIDTGQLRSSIVHRVVK